MKAFLSWSGTRSRHVASPPQLASEGFASSKAVDVR